MDLTYRDGMGKSVAVVYEGDSADRLTHIIRLEYESKLQIKNINLQLIDQPDFLNFPKNHLDYRNEVGMSLTLEEAHALARPYTLSPLQQELMSWYHRLYHLPLRILFRLASMGFMIKKLPECRNKPPLF